MNIFKAVFFVLPFFTHTVFWVNLMLYFFNPEDRNFYSEFLTEDPTAASADPLNSCCYWRSISVCSPIFFNQVIRLMKTPVPAAYLIDPITIF